MPDVKRPWPPRRHALQRQSGAAAVEFALVAIIFFTFVFGIVEVARAMYVINTLQEVTRRAASAAANSDFSNAAARERVRRYAVFRETPGMLLLAAPVSDEFIRIDYLSIQRGAEGSQTFDVIAPTSLPASPQENRRQCLKNPNASQCIRLVRARVCRPGGADCVGALYQPLLPFVTLPLRLHTAPTIVTAETLGVE